MPMLIGDVLAGAAALRPNALAATLGRDSVNFAEADAGANRAAHALYGLGVRSGDVVAWWSVGDLRSIDGFFACARLGAVFAPLSPLWSPPEARTVLEYLAPRLLVVDAARADLAADFESDLGLAWVIDSSTSSGSPSPPPPLPSSAETDPHIVYLTSGTTGRPKGVVVSHRASWLRSFPGAGTFSLGLQGRDGGILTNFPLFHYGGWHYVLEAWMSRCPVHVVARADADHLLEAVARWRPAGMYCIPAVWARILEAAPPQVDLGCIRHADSGTSATPVELLMRLKRRLPQAATSVFYGSTEAGHHTTLADWDVARKPGSVGRAAPPQLLRLDPDGEVCIRSDTLMTGYHRMAEETAAALADGWYHTGDLGHLDEEGYLFITGRKREVIRSGGEGVAPIEVESALSDCPGVVDVAVVGLPDERWGELVCAVVVAEGGRPLPSVQTVRDHLRGRLAPFKHPRRVVVVESIPRTSATGQIQRTLLRESVALADSQAPAAAHGRPGSGGSSEPSIEEK